MARRRAPARRRLPKNVPEIASCSEVFLTADATSNTMYGPNTLGLDQFKRASGIARQYQEYRITNIKYTFKPQFDTFAVNTDAATALRIPHLYYMIDKAQSLPLNTTLATLRSMGAKPRRFDDKDIVVSWAPGVQLAVNAGALAGTLSKPMISPWLSTNANPDASWTPSSTDHAGIYFQLDAGVLPGDGTYEYGVEVECQFQFRKPMLPIAANEESVLAKDIFGRA